MTNYNVSAELYAGRNGRSGAPRRYQRFASLAEAVRFTVEQLPAASQATSLVEADEVRYDGKAIRELYYSDSYPLSRAFVGATRRGAK